MSRPLTARGVKVMLAKARVDYSALTITETASASEWPHTVKIEGPAEPRRAAFWVLFPKGVIVAPYPEYDLWCRR